MQIVPRMKIARIQKMIKKYNEFQYNLAIKKLYTLYSIKIKNFFYFFLNLGTIGTIKKN